MKFLLTSIEISNESIHRALVDLLGKPTTQSKAICIPTAIYALPGGTSDSWVMLPELEQIGWQEFGVLELTSLPTTPKECWLPAVEAADVIIVGGGNAGYLSYCFYESGFVHMLLALLQDKVYLGISAGSAMVTHSINVNHEKPEETGIYYDDEYDEGALPNAGSDKTLKLVNFVIRPHLHADYFPIATLDNMEQWATKVDVPLYASGRDGSHRALC